ncbi:MAG: GNAT family N-acetyltransferase [Thermomicrobiales bacterium]|nr:GNAT family N-acetyltransferase [Thermomicrobiales bacterium]
MSSVTIQPAMESDKPAIGEMMNDYIADLARYTPISPNHEGRYIYPRLDEYWLYPGTRFPFLIYAEGSLAGFVLVSRESRLEDEQAMNIAEFYVLPEERQKGLGFEAAQQILRRFPGRWEVAVLATNTTAIAFWTKVILAIASDGFTEHSFRSKGPIYSFTVGETGIVP